MKSLFRNISLALLLLCTTAAQANEDTVHLFRISFGVPVTKVVLNDYCRVTVVADSEEYLTLSNHRRVPAKEMLFHHITRSGVLTLNADPHLGRMTLHLAMNDAIEFIVNDYSKLYISSCKMNSLSVSANDYAHVNLGNQKQDTLDILNVKVDANDFSRVSLGNIVNTVTYSAQNHDLARISISDGDILSLSSLISIDSIVLPSNDSSFSISAEPYNRNRHLRQEDYRSLDDDEDCSPIVDQNVLVIGWGVNNWLSQPFNILDRTSGDYEMNSSFRSFHVGYNWYLLRSCHWAMGIGLEYESSIYAFANPYVQREQNGELYTLRAIDRSNDEGKWTTRINTRYINFPLSVRWSPNGEFYLGLSAIFGVNINSNHTGIFHRYKTDSGKIKDRQSTPGLMTPYKADVRLSIGKENLMFYIQATATDIFQNMDTPVYPAQLGFLFEL